MRLTDLLALCHVPRWSIVPHLRPQSVAEHSFRVWVIYRELCDRLGILSRANEEVLLSRVNEEVWALIHDGPESRTGDIPGNFKRKVIEAETQSGPNLLELELDECPWLREFSAKMHSCELVKIADLIETYTYIRMWGHGDHAFRVSDRCFRQLHEFVRASSFTGQFNIIDAICTDIINDVGRDRS